MSSPALDLDATVRVHAAILRLPWSSLWYLARAADPQGRGRVTLSWSATIAAIDCSCSTLYRHLKAAAAASGVRSWRRSGDRLEIFYGSLAAVCKRLNIRDFGAAAEIPVGEAIAQPRAIATGLQTQRCQQASLYTVRRCNRQLRVPDPSELLKARGLLSSDSRTGATVPVPRVLARHGRWLYVSQSFPSYGSSQRRIAAEIGVSDRTVRRHLAALGLERVQIAQQDKRLERALFALAGQIEPELAFHQLPGPAQNYSRERVFRGWGRNWVRRCNVYEAEQELKSCRRRRREIARAIDKQALSISATRAAEKNHKLTLSSRATSGPKRKESGFFPCESQLPAQRLSGSTRPDRPDS